ncbi:MAG: BACON domain-containing protein, partial [Tidjanibacter sp.]|nr:BACON domain-containing protein [Tidjanibacter sp.]
IDFITQDAWQAAISQPGEERIPEWLSVSPESGDEGGTYSMHIALLPNENNSDRTALITITCGKDEVQARITQKATDDSGNGTGDEDEDEDSLIFADGTPQALTLPAAGSEIDLAFSASGPWQAEITDGVEWIVLSQAAGEAGEHSLTVTVAENAAPVQRAAEITFTCGTSAVTFSITQQAAEI